LLIIAICTVAVRINHELSFLSGGSGSFLLLPVVLELVCRRLLLEHGRAILPLLLPLRPKSSPALLAASIQPSVL
jgi:hypothetical protein